MDGHSRTVLRPVLALLMALSLSAGIAEAQTRIKSGFNLFSAEQDAQIGQQSAAEAESKMPILRDSQVQAYVDRIGQRLASKAGGPGFQYQFKVVNASDINAFALPGGYIYLNRGIIDQSRNEGEVAGVMAHEIAHVALRHGTHQASKAYAAQAGLSILGGLLGGKVGGNAANIINAVGGVGLNVLFLKFTRELETQADVRGAQILADAGYSPVDMVNFFHTLESTDKSRKTSFLSDHPAPPDRISRIEKEAQLLNVSDRPTTNVAELNRVQQRMRSTYGAAQTMAQIARSGPSTSQTSGSRGAPTSINVDPPSTAMRSYTNRSGLYRLSYPQNWKVYEQGTAGVTIAPEGGIGEINGKTEVVYGVIVNHYDPFGASKGSRFRGNSGSNVYGQNISLEDASNDLIAQLQQSGPHLKAVRNSTQRFTLSGGNALAVALRGTNPTTGIAERVTVVTRKLADDHLIYMLFVTPDRDAQSYSKVLQDMVNSMRIDDEAHG